MSLSSKVKRIWQIACVYVNPRNIEYEFQIETTNFCNARCAFCPNPTLNRKKQVMSMEVFEKIINRIKNENIKVRRFILHLNGEPLTDPYLFDRINRIHQQWGNVPVRFTTNFGLANSEIREKILESGIDEITISLNSIDSEEYSNIMGLSYEKTMENVRAFLLEKDAANVSMRVNFSIVARPENKDMVKLFVKEFKDKGNVRIIKLGKWVSDEDNCKQQKEKTKRVCNSLYDTIAILSNGDLALCCFDAEGVINKNIMDNPILKTWKQDKFKKIRTFHLLHGMTNKECRNCSFS